MFQRGKAVKEAEYEARNLAMKAAIMKNLVAVKAPPVAVVFALSGSEGLL
jgi:hypothetical protein